MNKDQSDSCSSKPYEKWHSCWGKMYLRGPALRSGEARTASGSIKAENWQNIPESQER